MGKLPKSLQQKKRNARSIRTQGSSSMGNSPVSNKGLNRQARRRMQQQGMEGMEQIDAQKVIIQINDGEDLIIEDPQVIKVNQQGMEVYQVIGNAKKMNSGENIDNNSAENMIKENIINNENEEFENEEFNTEITDEDIKLVMMQTGVSEKSAKNALVDANGDLAKAIINLKTK